MTQQTSTRDKMGRAVGACTACGHGIASDGVTGGTVATCPNCHRRVTLHYVYGEHSETPCDGSCMAAIGRICSCACGGVNHGRWNLPIELVPVWERDNARKAQAKRVTDHTKRADTKRAKQETAADAGRAALLAEHPALASILDEAWFEANAWGRFMDDMRDALRAGWMSPRQARAASDAVVRADRKRELTAKREAEKAALVAAGVAVVPGRRVITGEIIGVKEVDDNFSRFGATIVKITVREESGAKVWGTLPKSVWDDDAPQERGQGAYTAWFNALRGRTISMTATVEQGDRDPAFGFYKRPAKITLG
jgi:hypothetical protein